MRSMAIEFVSLKELRVVLDALGMKLLVYCAITNSLLISIPLRL